MRAAVDRMPYFYYYCRVRYGWSEFRNAKSKLWPEWANRMVGGGSPELVGRHLAQLICDNTDIAAGSRVLDVGCGIGRVAYALAVRFAGDLRYSGFDIVPQLVKVCENRMSGFPEFEFRHLDVRHPYYNPKGNVDPERVELPWNAESFHVVIVTSVLTHLAPSTTGHYLSEIARVLEPGGTLFATLFVNPGWTGRGGSLLGKPVYQIAHGCWTVNKSLPEYAFAYSEALLSEFLTSRGFTDLRIVRGSWSGDGSVEGQDVLVANRAPS